MFTSVVNDLNCRFDVRQNNNYNFTNNYYAYFKITGRENVDLLVLSKTNS